MIETLRATEMLIKEGFQVMVYCSDDPLMAKRLEDMGAVAIMPLASPDRFGMGMQNPVNIRMIIEEAKVPVIVDAGVGTASDAAVAMELGCDAVLINTAHRRCEKSRDDGARDETRGGGGQVGVARRPHAEESAMPILQPAGRIDLTTERGAKIEAALAAVEQILARSPEALDLLFEKAQLLTLLGQDAERKRPIWRYCSATRRISAR